jgi:NTE family protein
MNPGANKNGIGLALGGGGARGLAHILVFEALDEMAVRPQRMAGTSSGAVLGALYAAGRSGKEIRELVTAFLSSHKKQPGSVQFLHTDMLKWVNLIHPNFGSDRLLDTSNFLAFIHNEISVAPFAELKIPFSVITTDVWRHEQVILDSGDLVSAVSASIAFPGLFRPVFYQGRSLVDGGLVNPVPYDILATDCDITIGVDVSGRWTTIPRSPPHFFDNIINNSFQTMGKTILAEKLKYHSPDIYIRPELVDIHLLDFRKFETIFAQASPAKDTLKHALSTRLGGQ